MKRSKIRQEDIEFEYFKRANSMGGQKMQKTSSAVRAKHLPTGIVVESSNGRSQSNNKTIAVEKLQKKLDELQAEKEAKLRQDGYQSKPDSSFASQKRTYRLCGNSQNVTDHETGIVHNNSKSVLDGEIDKFLLGFKAEAN
jgi:peptide chain release factor 2